jgi:hypothetical protein
MYYVTPRASKLLYDVLSRDSIDCSTACSSFICATLSVFVHLVRRQLYYVSCESAVCMRPYRHCADDACYRHADTGPMAVLTLRRSKILNLLIMHIQRNAVTTKFMMCVSLAL